MTTPILITGWEHGVATPVTSGGGLCDSLAGAPAVSSAQANSGSYALRCYAASSATPSLRYNVSTPATIVGRVYFRFAAWPSVDNEIVYAAVSAGPVFAVKFNTTTKKLFARFFGTSSGAEHATACALDTWYRLDFKFDASTGTSTIDFKLDGVDGAQLALTQAATTFTGVIVGPSNSGTLDMYADDLIVTATSADYPIGPGGTQGLSPTGDGTHNAGTNVMEDNAGTDIGATTAYDKVDAVPISSATTYIQQAANGTGNYAAVNFANITATHSAIIGASALLAYTSASASANTGGCIITKDDFATSTTLWGAAGALADYSEGSTSAPYYKRVIVAGVVDDTTVNALAARLGYSDDANPDPYWLNLMVEVAYTISAGATYTETAKDELPHVASGANPVIRVNTAQDVSTHQASGAIVPLHIRGVDTGASISTHQASGVDRAIHLYAETGTVESAHQASGVDRAIHLYIETSATTTPRETSGADVLKHLYNESSTAALPHVASGVDVLIHAETVTAQSSKQTSAVSGQVYTHTGSASAPHVAKGVDIPWYHASRLTLTTGAISSGQLEDTYTDNGAELVLTEVNGTPGFVYDFTFGEYDPVPSSVHTVLFRAWYQGNKAHNVKLQQWNYTSSTWTNVTGAAQDFPDVATEQTYQFSVNVTSDYLSNGQVKFRLNHTSPGNPLHLMHLDYIQLTGSIVEAASVESPREATGADVVIAADTAQTQAPHVASAADVVIASDTGASEAPHVASGADVISHLYDESGAAEQPKESSGSDALIATDSANAEAPHEATGEDVFIPLGIQTYTETGAGISTAEASGADIVFHLYIETTNAESPRETSGADIVRHIYNESATATATCSVEGLDVVIASDTGAGASPRAGSVYDVLFQRIVYVDTGAAESPHGASGYDAFTSAALVGGGTGGWIAYQREMPDDDDEVMILAAQLLLR